MITVTTAAAERIRLSAAEAGVSPVILRVAAKRAADGRIEFGMGFDESRTGDTTEVFEGFVVVVAAPSREMVEGTQLDFAEVAPGDHRFVFAAPGEGGEPAPE